MNSDFLGRLAKEKKHNAKKATTYYIKTIVDKDWHLDTFNKFVNKLAAYSVKINEYMDAYKQPDEQDNTEGNDEKMDTSSILDDTDQSQNKSQSFFQQTDKIVSENTTFSLKNLDFDVNGGAIIPPPSSQTSAIPTPIPAIRTPLSTVDTQQVFSVNTPPNASQKHPIIPQLQTHPHPSSNAFSPPSIFPIFTQDKSSPSSAQKRLRFELNAND